jgi:DNA repair protein RadC
VGGKTEEKLSYEVKKMDSSSQKWRHPGGKLRELGPESLTDTELLAILISSGIKGRPAEKIAEDVLASFGSFKGMAKQPLHKFLEIRGLGDVKIIRIAAAFEIARRIVNQVLKDHEK